MLLALSSGHTSDRASFKIVEEIGSHHQKVCCAALSQASCSHRAAQLLQPQAAASVRCAAATDDASVSTAQNCQHANTGPNARLGQGCP